MTSHKMAKLDDFKDNEMVIIDASKILPHKIAVKTPHGSIKDNLATMLDMPRDEQMFIYRKLYVSLLKVDFDALFTRLRTIKNPIQDPEWKMVCNDIICVTCLRFTLFGTYIPLILNGTFGEDFTK